MKIMKWIVAGFGICLLLIALIVIREKVIPPLQFGALGSGVAIGLTVWILGTVAVYFFKWAKGSLKTEDLNPSKIKNLLIIALGVAAVFYIKSPDKPTEASNSQTALHQEENLGKHGGSTPKAEQQTHGVNNQVENYSSQQNKRLRASGFPDQWQIIYAIDGQEAYVNPYRIQRAGDVVRVQIMNKIKSNTVIQMLNDMEYNCASFMQRSLATEFHYLNGDVVREGITPWKDRVDARDSYAAPLAGC